MAFRASIRAAYDVALYIPGELGPAGRTHGHRYTVEAVLEAERLDESGFVVDFDRMQPRLAALAKEIDHHLLNELEPFRGMSPSAERQAEFFYDRLAQEVRRDYGPRVRLAKIRIIQEPEAWVEYEP